MSERPFAYVCSPYRGDIEANVERARSYCREVFEAGYIPLAPHLIFPQFLNDNIPNERNAGMEMAAALLPQCRVMVVCGNEITEGMAREVKLAQELSIESCTLENIEFLPSIQRGFSAYIANAEDYQNGELVGAWHYFPTTREAFEETLALIGVEGESHLGYVIEEYRSVLESIRSLPDGVSVSANELNYLAVKLEGLTESQLELFDAAVLAGMHENTIQGAINIAENIDCIHLRSLYDAEQYGRFMAAADRNVFNDGSTINVAMIMNGFIGKKITDYISHLEQHMDYALYGQELAAKEGGVFTERGYLFAGADFCERYHGPDNVPRAYRVEVPADTPQIGAGEPPAKNANKPSVLDQIAAARVDQGASRDKAAPDKSNSRGPEL